MRTIVETITGLSKYVVDDGTDVVMGPFTVTLPDMVIGDLNSGNSVVYDGVTPPDDWAGNLYFYDGSTWARNPWYPASGRLADLTLDVRREQLLAELDGLADEMSALVTKCRLLNDPEPQGLTDLMAASRAAYARGKAEVAALTEDDYMTYSLRGPLMDGLLAGLRSYL